MLRTVVKVRTNSKVIYSYGHKGLLELAKNLHSSTLCCLQTYQGPWQIGTYTERKRVRKIVLSACLDNEDDNDDLWFRTLTFYKRLVGM